MSLAALLHQSKRRRGLKALLQQARRSRVQTKQLGPKQSVNAIPPALVPFMPAGKRFLKKLSQMKTAKVRTSNPISGTTWSHHSRNPVLSFGEDGTPYLSDRYIVVPADSVPPIDQLLSEGKLPGQSLRGLGLILASNPAAADHLGRVIERQHGVSDALLALSSPFQNLLALTDSPSMVRLGQPELGIIDDRALVDTKGRQVHHFPPTVAFRDPEGALRGIQGLLFAAAIQAVGQPWEILGQRSQPNEPHVIRGPKGVAIVMPVRLTIYKKGFDVVWDYVPQKPKAKKPAVSLPQADPSAQATSLKPYRADARRLLRNMSQFNLPRLFVSFLGDEPYMTDGSIAVPLRSAFVHDLLEAGAFEQAAGGTVRTWQQLAQRFTRSDKQAARVGEVIRRELLDAGRKTPGPATLPASRLAEVIGSTDLDARKDLTPISWPFDVELVGDKSKRGRQTIDNRTLVFDTPKGRMGVHPVNLAAVLEAVGTPVQLYVQDSLKPLYLRGPRGVGVVAPVFVRS